MTDHTPSPRARRIAVTVGALVALEAAAYLVLVVLDVTDMATSRLAIGLGVGILLLGYAGLHLWAAWRLQSFDEHARGPIVVLQLIQLGIAWNLREVASLSLILVVVALAVLALVLHPQLTREVTGNSDV